MIYEQITYEKNGNVGVITLNRPERLNAWTRRMSSDMTHAVVTANDDPSIGAIVMTGAGRGFCAGADVDDQFDARLSAREQGSDQGGWLDDDWVTVVRNAKPMIAAVNGAAVGIGMTMILPFDIVIASKKAKFGMFFIRMGLTPELASTYYLVQRAGFGHASEMCLTGRTYSGEEAAACGLANKVVEHAELFDVAMESANLIASYPDKQLKFIKELLSRNAVNSDHDAVIQLENDYLETSIQSAEHKEAIRAFQEKREPKFR